MPSGRRDIIKSDASIDDVGDEIKNHLEPLFTERVGA